MTSQDARSAMIDAAEAIVAGQGLSAMSLREVQVRAGQLNKNAAQYHFGGREGLIRAVVEARMGPINERRRQLIAEFDATAAADPRTLVEIMIVPLAQAVLTSPKSQYARFLAQAFFDPQLSAMIIGHIQAGSVHEVRSRMIGKTGLPTDIERLRFHEVTLLTIGALASWERFPDVFPDPARFVTDLVDTATAVIFAPSRVEDSPVNR